MSFLKDIKKFAADSEKNLSKGASAVKSGFESKQAKSVFSFLGTQAKNAGGGISSAAGSVSHATSDVYKDALRPAAFGIANIAGDTAKNLNSTIGNIGGSSFLVPVIGLVAVAFILTKTG